MIKMEDIFPEESSLKSLANKEFDKQRFLVQVLSGSNSDLNSLKEELSRLEKKVGSVSDGLILRNCQHIISGGREIEEKLQKSSEDHTLLQKAESKLKQIDTIFLSKLAKIEESSALLRNLYSAKRLSIGYQKLIHAIDKLENSLSKGFDPEASTDLYSKCIQNMHLHSFEGLNHFEQLKERLEASKKSIVSQLDPKLAKALETYNFIEARTCLNSYDNIGIMQTKVQEIANKTLRENFEIIKNLFTSQDSDSSQGEDVALLEKFEGLIDEMMAELLKNSMKIWVIEVTFYERRSSIKEKELVTLFALYFQKLQSVIVQTFKKLIENKSKFQASYGIIYLCEGYFNKAFKEMIERIFTFMISHCNGSQHDQLSLKDLSRLYQEELPAILMNEFQSILKNKFASWSDLRTRALQEVESNSVLVLTKDSISGFNRFTALLEHLFTVTPSERDFIIDQFYNWARTLFDSLISSSNPEDGEDADPTPAPSKPTQSASQKPQPALCRLYKTSHLLTMLTQALLSIQSRCKQVSAGDKIEDMLNTLCGLRSSVGRKLVAAVGEAGIPSNEAWTLSAVFGHSEFESILAGIVLTRAVWAEKEIKALCYLSVAAMNINRGKKDFAPRQKPSQPEIVQEFLQAYKEEQESANEEGTNFFARRVRSLLPKE
jgi:hypothetical protein